MRRIVMISGLILLVGSTVAFAQSIDQAQLQARLAEYQAKLAEASAQLAQLSQDQSGFHFYQPSKSKSGATAALQTGLQGTWWRESMWIRTLELTPDQQKKMDEAFLQHRLRLIDLTAALEKEELILEPLVESSHAVDEAKIVAQIDKVADARAGLEKANSRMLLAIRQILTQDQWNKLQLNRGKHITFPGGDGSIWGPPVPAPPTPPPAPK